MSKSMSYRICTEWNDTAKAVLRVVLRTLEETTKVGWFSGDTPTELDKSEASPVYYLCYDSEYKCLLYSDSPDTDLKECVVSELNDFIDFINKDMGRTNEVSVETVKEASHWNAVCVCGADAYDDGFKYECKNSCGSLGPKDRRF